LACPVSRSSNVVALRLLLQPDEGRTDQEPGQPPSIWQAGDSRIGDGKGHPLAVILGPGQGGDSPMFPVVMDAVRVPRLSGGRPRTRPEAVMGDKAYSSRANRSLMRDRRNKTVIPEPSDQIGHRKRRGSRGGRPVNFDAQAYKQGSQQR
jgi:hypothetical protein